MEHWTWGWKLLVPVSALAWIWYRVETNRRRRAAELASELARRKFESFLASMRHRVRFVTNPAYRAEVVRRQQAMREAQRRQADAMYNAYGQQQRRYSTAQGHYGSGLGNVGRQRGPFKRPG